MQIWRIVKKAYADNALDGEGARITGGRWNLPGTPMVYTSSHLSLALIEILVHFEPGNLPRDYVYIEIHVPSSVRIIRTSPNKEQNSHTQELGTAWAQKKSSALMEVSSIILPIEKNYLINPKHPDFKKFKISKPQNLTIDPRLLVKQ